MMNIYENYTDRIDENDYQSYKSQSRKERNQQKRTTNLFNNSKSFEDSQQNSQIKYNSLILAQNISNSYQSRNQSQIQASSRNYINVNDLLKQNNKKQIQFQNQKFNQYKTQDQNSKSNNNKQNFSVSSANFNKNDDYFSKIRQKTQMKFYHGVNNQANQNIQVLGQLNPKFQAIQIKELMEPIISKTRSSYFGQQLEDYILLCQSLNLKLSRAKAYELNIAARGGANSLNSHLIKIQKRASIGQINQKVDLIDFLRKGNASQLGDNNKSLSKIVIENEQDSIKKGTVPPADPQKISQWLNLNFHHLDTRNYLKFESDRNLKSQLLNQSSRKSTIRVKIQKFGQTVTEDQKTALSLRKTSVGFSNQKAQRLEPINSREKRQKGLNKFENSSLNNSISADKQLFIENPSELNLIDLISQNEEQFQFINQKKNSLKQGNTYISQLNINNKTHSTSFPNLQGKSKLNELIGSRNEKIQQYSQILNDQNQTQYNQSQRAFQTQYKSKLGQTQFFNSQLQNEQEQQNQIDLRDNINKTLRIIQKNQKLFNHVQQSLHAFEEEKTHQSIKDGVQATLIAKLRVHQSVKKKDEEMKKGIENLINQQTDAIHAKNLERLLTKNWNEYDNSYVILSKIKKFSKTEDRVNKLLGYDRYS